MKPFLSCAFAVVALVVLTSFALQPELASSRSATTQAVTPLKLADLTLDRVMKQVVSVPYYGGPAAGAPVAFVAPSSLGIVIVSIAEASSNLNNTDSLYVAVNGVAVESVTFGSALAGSLYFGQRADLAVPIVVRPGDSCAIWQNQSSGSFVDFVLSGYVVYPGEV